MGHKGQAALLGDETGKELQRNALSKLESLAREQTERSLEAIQKIRDDYDVDPRVRLAAAQSILEWGWGKGRGVEKSGERAQELARGGLTVLLVSYNANGEPETREVSAPRPLPPANLVEEARRQLQQESPCESPSAAPS